MASTIPQPYITSCSFALLSIYFISYLYLEVLNFLKPMWRKDEKAVAIRTEQLEKRLAGKGFSPMPAKQVRKNIKKFNLGRWQEYIAMWTYEVMWSARTKELSQRSSFCGQIFFDIRVLFGSPSADTYLWWPKLVLFSVLVFSLY